MLERVFRVLAMVWVGSQLTIGFLVAPTLFSLLPRVTAGDVAGNLFHSEAIIGGVCATLLLSLGNALVRRGWRGYRELQWIVLAMLLLVIVGYFALQPFMAGLRDAARDAGVALAQSRFAARFGLLHGISSALYVVETLAGILLVWRLPVAAGAMPAQPAGPGG